MKYYFSFFMFCFVSSFIISCQNNLINSTESDSTLYNNEFQLSFDAFKKFQNKNNNSYKYIVHNSSWSGLTWETSISVQNGKVVQRHFKYFLIKGFLDELPENEKEWTETGEQVGSHLNTSAADPLTLDEIYEKAKSEWLIKRENSTHYFETKNDGMLSLAGYTDNYCADDCFVGVRIKSIEKLTK